MEIFSNTIKKENKVFPYLIFVLNGEFHLSKNSFFICPHPDEEEISQCSTVTLLLICPLFHIQFPIMHCTNTAAWHAEKPSPKTAAHTRPSLHWTPIILIVCTTQLALYYILSCSLIVCTTQFSTLLHSVRFCNRVMYFCLVLPPRSQAPRWQGPCLVLLWHFPQHQTLFQEQQSGSSTNTGQLLVGGWVGRLVDWHSDGL